MRIILFSDSQKIFDITSKVIGQAHELECCSYDNLRENRYSYADIVIMHFEPSMIEKGTFEPIIRVKGRLGHTVPILTLIEGGTPQDIFSTLKAGAYDYVETIEDKQNYKKKIDEIVLWSWYINHFQMKDNKQ